MNIPVFKTFESAEGLLEWAMRVFALTMIVLHGQGLEPSEPAQVVAKTILSANCNTFKELYHDAARSFHPDKNDSDTNADMALINNAYEKRKARGGCRTKTKGGTKTRTKARTKAKGGTKTRTKTKGGTKTRTKAKGGTKNRRSQEKKDNSLSMGQLVAGIGVGCVVGYTAKECRSGRSSHKRPQRPSSPGRRR